MATCTTELSKFLKIKDVPHEIDGDVIYLIGKTKSNGLQPMMIRTIAQGYIAEFHAVPLFQIKDHRFKGVVLQTMAIISWQYPCLKLSYQPEHGTVGASIEVPLLDMELSQTTFWYCLNRMIISLDEFMPRLQSVLANGREKSAWEQMLDKMPADPFNS